MARSTCEPCCQPQQLATSELSYRTGTLIVLCDILEALGGGVASSYRFDWELLCDPSTGAPVFVKFAYVTDGTLQPVTAVNPDGSAYGGAVAALISCNEFWQAGGSGGGTSMQDDTAFTVGTTDFTPAGGTYRSVRDSVNDGDGGAFAMTATRALYATLETPLGDSAMDDTNDAVRVNVVAGAGSGGTAMTDDSAFTVGTTNFTPAGGTYRSVRDSVNDNDGGAFAMTATRALYATLETPLGDSAMDDTNDAVRVNVVAGSSSGPSKTDDTAFTIGSDLVAPMGALADDTASDSVNEGDVGIPRMSLNRILYNVIRDAAGNERGANVTAANALVVDGSAVTQPVSIAGTVAVTQSGTWNINNISGTISLPTGAATSANQTTEITSLQLLDDVVKTDDSAFTPGTDKVSMVGAEFDDTTPDSVDEGDAGALRMSANRNLYIQIRDISSERSASVTAANALKVDGSAVTQPVSGTVSISGTVAATQSGTWNINNISGTISLPTGAATSANQTTEITSLQLIDDVIKTDDAAFTPATDKVAMIGAEFDDTTPDSVDEGDAGAIRMSANRNLYVRIRDNAGNERGLNVDASGNIAVTQSGTWNITNISGTISLPTGASTLAEQQTQTTALQLIDNIVFVDDAAFTPGTTSMVPVGGTYRSVRDTVNDNDGGVFAMTASRALLTAIETPAGDSAMDDTNDAVRVNVVAGSSSGPGKVDDSAFSIGVDSVNPIGALADESGPDSVNEGDVGLVRMSLNRILYNTIRDAAGNERGANVTAANELLVSVNNATLAVTQSGTWNINNISGTVSLPTGASTFAEQQTQTTALQLIDNIVFVDDAAFTPGTTSIVPVGGTYRSVRDSVNDNDGGVFAMTATRALYTSIETPNGDSAMDDTNDAVRVNIVAGAGSGGTAMVDDSAFTVGSTSFTPAGGIYRSSRDSVDDNDGGAFAMTASRAMYSSLETPLGQSAMDDTADAVKVLLVQTSGSAMTSTDILKVGLFGVTGGTILVDDAAFTVGADRVFPIGALADETTPDSVNEGDVGIPRMSLNRNLYTVLRDAAGNERGANINASNQLSVSVDNTPAVSQSGTWNINNISGTISLPTGAATSANQATEITSLQLIDDIVKTDDAAFTPATDKVAMIGAEFDDTTPDSVDEGDAGAIRMSANRNLYVRIRDDAGNERGLNIDSSGRLTEANSASILSELQSVIGDPGVSSLNQVLSIGTTDTLSGLLSDLVSITGRLMINGPADIDTAQNWYPVPIGGFASTATPSAVSTDGDLQNIWLNRLGAVKTVITDDAGDSCMDGTNDALRVNVVAGSSGGPSKTDDTAFSIGVDAVAPMGALADDTTPDSVNEGDVGIPRMSLNRILYNTIRDAAGNERGANVNASNQLSVSVDNTPAVTQSGTWNINNISGTVSLPTGASTFAEQQTQTTALQLIDNIVFVDDAAFTPGTTSMVPVGGTYRSVRDTVNDNDGGVFAMTATRALYTSIETPNGDSAMDDTNDAVRVNIVAGAGSGGTAMTDDAAFTVGTTSFTPAGGTYKSVRDSVDDNDGGAFAMTATRALYTSVETPNGQSAMDDTADAVKVLLVQTNGSAMTSTNILNVGLVGVTGGIALVDDAAFTTAADRVLPIGCMFDDVSPDSVNEGDIGVPRMSANRNVYHTIRDAAGNERGANVTAASELLVSVGNSTLAVTQSGTWNITNISGTVSLPTGASTLAEQQTQTTSLQLLDDAIVADDAAFTPATTKVMMAGFEFDDTTPDSVNEGDAGAARMSANRNIYITIRDAAGNERGVNVDATNRLSVSVDNSNVSTNIAQMNGVAVTMGNGASGTGVQRVTIASDSTGTVAVTQATASNLNAQIVGNVAHDTADSGNPVSVGGVAVSGSASPTSVAAGDRTRHIYNQHGIPYVIGGHPNLITREYDFGTSAQTDVNLAAASVAADERVYVTRLEITCDAANTVNVSARAGFGTANVPSASSSGVSGMIASHPGIAPGSGVVSGNGAGVIAVGAAGEEPRITTSAATSGNTHVLISYYLIDETP